MKRLFIAAAAIAALSCFALADGPPTPGQAQLLGSVNGSVTITTGNTYQTILSGLTSVVFPGTPSRRSVTIQNNNTNTDNCFIEITGLVVAGNTTSTSVTPPGGSAITAAKASILLGPGGSFQRYFPYIPSGAIVGTCASNGDSLYVDTQ